jgi:esterase/lipase superfamily enzyme
LHANGTPLPEIFNEVLLMAADIEYDIFERDEAFNSLIDLGSRVHVYFNGQDRVLDISKYTKNFSNRLGRYGRKRIDPTLAHVVDAETTGVTEDRDAHLEEKLLNHWYYYTSTEVITDVIEVLNGRESHFKQRSN